MVNRLAIILLSTFVLLQSCLKDSSNEKNRNGSTGSLTFLFESTVNNAPLVFGQQYTNDWSEPFTISKFRYYLHGFDLIDSAGQKVTISNDHFLVDEANPISKTITLPAPVGRYSAFSFILE